VPVWFKIVIDWGVTLTSAEQKPGGGGWT